MLLCLLYNPSYTAGCRLSLTKVAVPSLGERAVRSQGTIIPSSSAFFDGVSLPFASSRPERKIPRRWANPARSLGRGSARSGSLVGFVCKNRAGEGTNRPPRKAVRVRSSGYEPKNKTDKPRERHRAGLPKGDDNAACSGLWAGEGLFFLVAFAECPARGRDAGPGSC